jgi:hypothetical protein
MSIPNFKTNEDWEEFLNIFDDQWQYKREMLNRVKNSLFPEYKSWDQLQPKTLEVINDIVSNLSYEVERQFKETHQDYKTDDDDMFIPYRSFKENVAEALNEALDNRDSPVLSSESSLNQIDLGGK